MSENPLLFYRAFGETGNPCILILHGLLGCSDNWLTVAKKLSANYYVLIIDLRNHGQSFHHESMFYSEMAKDVENLILSLGLKEVSLLGHSMGGKVAMECLKRKKVPFKLAVVVDIAPKPYVGEHAVILSTLQSLDLMVSERSLLDSQLSKKIDSFMLRQFLLKTITRKNGVFIFKINIEAIISNYESILNFNPRQGDDYFDSDDDNNSEQFNTGDDYFQSLVPILFVRGDKSSYISHKDINFIRLIFKNSFFETVENAGHWVHSENHHSFMEVVTKFLNTRM